jgi:hypothetical protein
MKHKEQYLKFTRRLGVRSSNQLMTMLYLKNYLCKESYQLKDKKE